MRVLIDTNVLIDFMAMRAPYDADAMKIIDACDRQIIEGCIAAHSVPNIVYILRKHISAAECREILLRFCDIFTIESIDKYKLVRSLQDEKFTDFEDCLQSVCATVLHVDYIVTRNLKDFKASEVPAILPSVFCQHFLDDK